MRTNTASAKWRGTLWEGNGQMKLPHVSKEITYTAKSRFEDGEGSNPEELIAAAHAGCFSMAFANTLAGKGYQPKLVSTEARVTILKKEEGFTITKSELKTSAEVPDISEETFMELAETAKKNCPVSRALASVEITLEASLVKA
jgi:osmotically inducible protein OsmC